MSATSTWRYTPSMIRKFNLTNSKWKKTYSEKEFGFIPATEGLNDLEVLVLGVSDAAGDIVLVSPDSDVPLGARLH